MCDCLVGLRLVLSRVCLSCWVEVGFMMCVFVLLCCGWFYQVCVCVGEWGGFYHGCVCLVE